MKSYANIIRITLIILNIFLALTALAGCIQLLEGTYAPSLEMLNGSIFRDYTIPGLSLGLIVGGSALFTVILLVRRNKFADLASIAAGMIIMFFEFVEVQIIGSPAGIARNLQIFYFGLGTLIAFATLLKMFLEKRSER
jgi:hypothetical protein